MNALMRKKKEWEFQNEKFFMTLVETSADVSVESVKKAGLVTSFLLYLVYKTLEGVLAIAFAIFIGPRLVRQIAPEIPNEYVEISKHQLEIQVTRNPFIQR